MELSFSLLHMRSDGDRPDRVLEHSCQIYLSLPIFAATSELHITRDRACCDPYLEDFPSFPSLRVLVLSRDAVTDLTSGCLKHCARQFPNLEILRLTDYDCHIRLEATFGPLPDARDSMMQHVADKLCQSLRMPTLRRRGDMSSLRGSSGQSLLPMK